MVDSGLCSEVVRVSGLCVGEVWWNQCGVVV